MIKTNNLGDMNKREPDGLKPGGEPYKVLVVDDSQTMRKILIQILKSEAFNIVGEACDGEEAVAMYQELMPDIVSMDINMPKKSGMDALKDILKYDKKARVVMATSEGQKKTVIEAITTGAKDYIVKPPERLNVLEKFKNSLK